MFTQNLYIFHTLVTSSSCLRQDWYKTFY